MVYGMGGVSDDTKERTIYENSGECRANCVGTLVRKERL